MSEADKLKALAARAAVEAVEDGQVLGLGTGSTARFAVIEIGEGWKAGRWRNLHCVPTSVATEQLARAYGLPLIDLDAAPGIDLAIDGADEVDPRLDLIKGLGGALLREKAVESRARRFIVIVDPKKRVPRLGTIAPLPVEVRREGWEAASRWLASLGTTPVLRTRGDGPFITDNGNYLLDCRFAGGIENPASLAASFDASPQVLAHGLFLGMATEVIVGEPGGPVRLARA